MSSENKSPQHDPALIEKYVNESSKKLLEAKEEIGKVFFGQNDIVDLTLACMVANGHLLLEGVPGTGKTKLVSTISQIMGLSFNRTQFTPDLLPSDITGSEILEHKDGQPSFRFNKGPIFTQFFLADEINRAPGKTQAALLEAMEEKQVTIGGKTYYLPRPFFTMATQNPIEQEGTYQLPEAQLDRFLVKLNVGYPQEGIEKRIMVEKTETKADLSKIYNDLMNGKKVNEAKVKADIDSLNPVLNAQQLSFYQQVSSALPLTDSVVKFTTDIIRAARPNTEGAIEDVNKYVEVGPGPRAYLAFAKVAKARALIDGRIAPDIDDIKAIAPSILQHRLRLNFQAASDEHMNMDVMIRRLVEHAEKQQTPNRKRGFN